MPLTLDVVWVCIYQKYKIQQLEFKWVTALAYVFLSSEKKHDWYELSPYMVLGMGYVHLLLLNTNICIVWSIFTQRKLENNLKLKQSYEFIVYLKYNLEKNIETSRCEKTKAIKGDNDNTKSW